MRFFAIALVASAGWSLAQETTSSKHDAPLDLELSTSDITVPDATPSSTETAPGTEPSVSVPPAFDPTAEPPLPEPDDLPSVTIANGTVVGQRVGWVDTFKGIPFAKPPVGSHRLQSPEPLRDGFGTFYATNNPVACPMINQLQNPFAFIEVPLAVQLEIAFLFPMPFSTGENCLTLNVQRPTNTTADSKLPVLFWIYGGGFESGATQIYDFTNLVTYSIQLGHPVIVVQANYRQGAFGFLAGEQVSAAGAANLGLKDQRLALQWVAENIAAFGGDPDRVSIWGQSAGAVSVFYHTIINGGDHTYHDRPLFQGAIMSSGSASMSYPANAPVAQDMYDFLVNRTLCAYVSANATLDCLRRLSYDQLAFASAFIPSLVNLQGITFSVVPRPDPEDPFLNVSTENALFGSLRGVAPVPVIIGCQDDEGTGFAVGLHTVEAETTSGFIDTLSNIYSNLSRTILEELVGMYSTDPADGSPFGTGTENEVYPGYKRNAAVLGDLIFDFPRRAYLSAVSDSVKAWSYKAAYRKLPVIGTFHGSDLLMLVERYPTYAFYDTWQYYISFVYYQDPNGMSKLRGARTLPEWPTWKNDGRQVLEFREKAEVVTEDNARQRPFEFFSSLWSQFAN